MTRISLALVALVSVGLTEARAAGCGADATQSDLNVCADQALRKADATLNGAYRQIMDRLKDDTRTKELLVTAQKAWVAFRDSECVFATSSAAQVSIYPMLVATCHEDLTKKRTEALKAYLNCEEGDMSCPVPAK